MNKNKVQMSSGNIFADIGVTNPERSKLRSDIMFEIAQTIKKQKLTQKRVAEILGITQPKVSCLINGKLSMFSLDNLLVYLKALGNDVKIVTTPKESKQATIALSSNARGLVSNKNLARISTAWRNFRKISHSANKEMKNRVSNISDVGNTYVSIKIITITVSKSINERITSRT